MRIKPMLVGDDLPQQLDPADPLLQLSGVIPGSDFDEVFTKHYRQGIGAPSKPIRLTVGLLMLKQLENLSDESVVLPWRKDGRSCAIRTCDHRIKSPNIDIVTFKNQSLTFCQLSI